MQNNNKIVNNRSSMLRTTIFSRIIVRGNKTSNFIRVRTDVFDKLLTKEPRQINWDSIRSDLFKNNVTVNQTNVDSIIISKCFNGAHLDIALSYIDFLKSNSLKINDATISNIIRLYYNRIKKDGKEISEKDESEIIKWCNFIEQKEFVESTLAESIIHGLSLTREWKKCFKYLEKMKELDKEPSKSTYSCVLERAIKENREDIVWLMLKEMTSKNIIPKIEFFISWFEHHKNDLIKIEKMLEFIAENGLLLPEVKIQNIKDTLRHMFSVSLVTINRSGKCPACTQKLPGVKLLPEEFSKLAKTFFEDILVTNNEFLKTNPDEIKKFKEFVNKTAPYDIVIDGLNVSYSHGDKLSTKHYAKTLSRVVEHFVKNDQKCLVIGKNHMKHWPRADMAYIRNNSNIFYVDDLSHDDLFLIYAALKSGPKTNIFSRDLLRQHSHLLNKKMKQIFIRWQQEHQFQLVTTKGNNRIIVKEPILFELRAQKVKSTWHLPFTNEIQEFATQTFNLPSAWLCLRIKER